MHSSPHKKFQKCAARVLIRPGKNRLTFWRFTFREKLLVAQWIRTSNPQIISARFSHCVIALAGTSPVRLSFLSQTDVPIIIITTYCLTACLDAKCRDLIGWILELGPSIHFRIDGPDHLYGFRSKLKHGIFGKMVEKLSIEVVKC